MSEAMLSHTVKNTIIQMIIAKFRPIKKSIVCFGKTAE
jgi:hypothetical protein